MAEMLGGSDLEGKYLRTGIALIASGRLQALYRSAFDTLTIPVRLIDADDAILRAVCGRRSHVDHVERTDE
jgi:2-keto-3-deoxy-galactonokinase